MKKNVRKILAFTSSFALIGTGIGITVCHELSYKTERSIERYVETFDDDDFLVAAHRGYSSLEVENTIPSINRAADAKYVDYIEMDVRLTKDDYLVLSHNNSVKLLNGDTVRIKDTNYEDLEKYTLKYGTNYIITMKDALFNYQDGSLIHKRKSALDGEEYFVPTLQEGLKAAGDKKILLDLKFENDKKDFAEKLFQELEGMDKEQIIIQSLDLESLAYLKRKHPEYTYLGLLRKPNDLAYIQEFEYIGVEQSLLSRREILSVVKDPDRMVAVWTLNTMKDVNKACDTLGEHCDDVIYITDYPDVTSYTLNQNKTKKLVKKH
ncbi:MAG: hypothetical protein IJ193_01890 [Bacilli bacterium]|nr:hypothetical protein [Bacilli bacterium]